MAKFRTKIERYFFVDEATNKVFIKPRWFMFGERYCLCGIVKGREDLEVNTVICTSEVISKKGNVVITKDGSEYELEGMHEDYKDFLKAKRQGIPILTNWRIEANWRIEDVDGVYLMFGDEGANLVVGEVVSQNGNYVTLDDKITYFVMWSDINLEKMMAPINGESRLSKLGYSENFEHFAHKVCKPILFK